MAGLNPTKIEWVRGPDGEQGFTWNPVVGCSRGCAYCYARRIATTRLSRLCPDCAEFRPHLHGERLGAPVKRLRASGIFVCSMGELFDGALSLEAVGLVLAVVRSASWHRFYVLTKQGAVEHFRFGSHVWVGVSLDGRFADRDMLLVDALRRTRCEGVKFISYEPLIGPPVPVPEFVDWVIIGAQSGKAPWDTRPEWVEAVLLGAERLGVPYFIKDNLVARFPGYRGCQALPRGEGV